MPYPYEFYNSIDNGKLSIVDQQTYFSSSNIAAGSTVTLSTAPGTLQKVIFNQTGVYNFTLLDGANQLAQVIVTQAAGGLPSDTLYSAKTTTGLALTVASLSGNFTLMYR